MALQRVPLFHVIRVKDFCWVPCVHQIRMVSQRNVPALPDVDIVQTSLEDIGHRTIEGERGAEQVLEVVNVSLQADSALDVERIELRAVYFRLSDGVD